MLPPPSPPVLPIEPALVPPVEPALVPAALLPELGPLRFPELPLEPLEPLVPEVDFCALALSLDFLLDEPEVPDVPDVPDESVAPVMLLPLEVPVEPEPVPVDELCAIAMLLPNAETTNAIKSFFIYCLRR